MNYTSGNTALNLPHSSALPSSIRFTNSESRIFRGKEIDPETGLPITVAQWAERYRIVTDGDKVGHWSNANSPYAVEPMNCWTSSSIQEIYLCFAPQIVKTQIAFNCLSYSIDQDPGPIMYIMPDEKITARLMKNRLMPTIENNPRLASLLTHRAEDMTRTYIRFTNGVNLVMAWATSVAELSSEPIRYAIADEISKFPEYSGGAKKEASPIDLIRQRTNSFPYTKKLLFLSSPGAAPCSISRLMRYEADTVYRYQVPCPVCLIPQIMDDENIIVLDDTKDARIIRREHKGRYRCTSCGTLWDDYARNLAVAHGVWAPGRFAPDGIWYPSPSVVRPVAVAFHLPSWYSLNISLSDVAAARLRGQENPQKLMVYVTQHRAEEYSEVIATKKEENILADHKTALPSGVVPAAAIALVAGIDSHTWGYRFVVYACIEDTLGFTLQKIHHGLIGSLADVENLIYHARYPVEQSSNTMGILRAAIDTGGNRPGPDSGTDTEKTMTDEIYEWLRKQPRGTVYGIKGASHKQHVRVKLTVIDKLPHSTKPIPGGLELHIIDTDTFKELFHWRLTRGQNDTQRILFDADTDNNFVRELLAEERHIKRNRQVEWRRVRAENHYLDCTIYAMAAADAEWHPSLKIMSQRLKDIREGRIPQKQQRRILSRGVE